MTTDQERLDTIERLEVRREFWLHLAIYVAVNGFMVLIWALTGGGYFWPVWLIAVWAVALVMHGWTTFVQKPIHERDIEHDIHRRRDAGAPG